MRADGSRGQRGAALIEFALVLPLLLAIAVGIVYYGYAFVLKAAVEQAVRNGAQEMVAISPLENDYGDALLAERAARVVEDSLGWLPASVGAAARTQAGAELCPDEAAYGVRVRLPLTAEENPVLPQFSLGRFDIPPLPTGENGGGAEIVSAACVTL